MTGDYYRPTRKYTKLRAKFLQLLEEHGKNTCGTVLHVGSGKDTFRYKQYFPNAERYRCLDIKKHPNVDIVADVQDMPQVPSNSEDCIIATFFLLLVPDVKAALKEIKRVVKGGGTVFLTFINSNWKGFGVHRWTKKQALELLDGFFKDRLVFQSDIGIAVIAYKKEAERTPNIKISGVEIAKQNYPPYLQAKFFESESDIYETRSIGEKSIASCKQQILNDRETVFTYTLVYEESYAFMLKTWIKLDFMEEIKILFEDGSIKTINFRHDKPKKKFEGLTFGVHWDRVEVLFINRKAPLKFMFGHFILELLNPRQIRNMVLYRKNDLSEIELTFIWRRIKVPKGIYELVFKTIRQDK